MAVREMLCTGGPAAINHLEDCSCVEKYGNRISLVDGIPHLPGYIKYHAPSYACRSPAFKGKMYHGPKLDFPEARAWECFAHKPCMCNVLNAVCGRVYKCTPKANVSAVQQYLTTAVRVLADMTGKHRPIPIEDVYRHYPAKKRSECERAHNLLKLANLRVTAHDAKLKMFVKIEKIRFNESKVNPDCRAIQFRGRKYMLRLASAIKKAEHVLYGLKDIPGMGPGRVFAKGMNVYQRAEALWFKVSHMPGWKCIELDASRFDAHVQKAVLALVEHKFWEWTCLDPDIAWLLKLQLKNKVSARVEDGVLNYKVQGGRMSGDANTAAGNCIIMFAMLYAFGKYTGREFNFLCDGDDSVFFYKGEDIEDEEVETFFRQFGFVMKIENRPTSFEQIGFCQARPVWNGERWAMVRDPFKVMSSVMSSPKLYSPKGRNKYIRTVAMGELSLCRGVPVLQAYLKHLTDKLSLTKRQIKRGPFSRAALNENYRLRELLPSDWTSGETIPVSDQARLSFERAWGISVGRQIEIETKLKSWVPRLDRDEYGGKINVSSWSYAMQRPELW